MPLDTTPGEIQVKTRDVIKSDYLRDYRVRNPSADTGPNTQPDLDAAVFADGMLPIYNDAQVIGRATLLKSNAGDRLVAIGESEGLPKLPAVGASGSVTIGASSGGGTIFAGDIIKEPNTGLRYQCVSTALYLNNAQVPIAGLDTGPTTNQDAGTAMQWVSPRPGISPTAAVTAQNDGSGLTGGSDVESDANYINRIIDKRSNPPASGNEAEFIEASNKTPTVGVEESWAYPCCLGPGTMGMAFTVRPASLGASRLPNATQIALVLGQLVGQFPGDDGIFVATVLPQNIDVMMTVAWAPGAASWTDAVPWPPIGSTPIVYTTGHPSGLTSKTFRLTSGGGIVDPQVGQTIAVFDLGQKTFQRKKIGVVSIVTPNTNWDITVDTTNSQSDTSYTPVVGQVVSAWSDSLNDLPPALLGYFATLGVGEQIHSAIDPGVRQRRVPFSPAKWPNVLSNRMLTPVLALSSIEDAAILLPAAPTSTTIGTAGTISYLMQLNDLAFIPQ